MVAAYAAGVGALQVGYCVLLALSGTPETKRALIKGCGTPLMLANWAMGFWAAAWVRPLLILCVRGAFEAAGADSRALGGGGGGCRS